MSEPDKCKSKAGNGFLPGLTPRDLDGQLSGSLNIRFLKTTCEVWVGAFRKKRTPHVYYDTYAVTDLIELYLLLLSDPRHRRRRWKLISIEEIFPCKAAQVLPGMEGKTGSLSGRSEAEP